MSYGIKLKSIAGSLVISQDYENYALSAPFTATANTTKTFDRTTESPINAISTHYCDISLASASTTPIVFFEASSTYAGTILYTKVLSDNGTTKVYRCYFMYTGVTLRYKYVTKFKYLLSTLGPAPAFGIRLNDASGNLVWDNRKPPFAASLFDTGINTAFMLLNNMGGNAGTREVPNGAYYSQVGSSMKWISPVSTSFLIGGVTALLTQEVPFRAVVKYVRYHNVLYKTLGTVIIFGASNTLVQDGSPSTTQTVLSLQDWDTTWSYGEPAPPVSRGYVTDSHNSSFLYLPT